MDQISNTLALLGAISIASERVVEAVKGLCPWLNKETPDNADNEGRRKSAILIVAAISGILLAWLALSITSDPNKVEFLKVIALGLLSAGGSGFWNSIQSSLNQLKDAAKKLAS